MKLSELARLAACLLVVIAGLGPVSASADVVYDNGGPAFFNSPFLTSGKTTSGMTTADDFVLTVTATVTSVSLYVNPASSTLYPFVEYAIREDSGGLPGNVLAGGAAILLGAPSAYQTIYGSPVWLASFDVAPFLATVGTHYWLQMGLGQPTIWEQSVLQTGASAMVMQNGQPGASWWGMDAAFFLNGTVAPAVPEPATGTLFAAGLGLMVLVASRRRRLGV